MDYDNTTDSDLALSRKRGVERLIESNKLQDVISTDGKDSPTKRVCLRLMENAIKPDTPAIPSVRSRLVVIDRQLSAANDENTDQFETPQSSISLAAKSATQDVRSSRKDGIASRISEFTSDNWEAVDVPNLRRIKKPVDPALRPVSERMAGWQKKVDASSAPTEKGSPVSDRRKTVLEGKAGGADERNTVRSRLSMWEQKVSEEQERAATPVVAPRVFHVEREVGIREGLEGKVEMEVVYVHNAEKSVSHEVVAAPKTIQMSAIPSVVTPPTPAARTSIYHLIKKPSPATSLLLSTPTPSARPAPVAALVDNSACRDGEASEKAALDSDATLADSKMSQLSTASEENGIVKKCIETDVLDRREFGTTEETQNNVTEIVTLGNAEPEAESIEPPKTRALEEVTFPIPAAHGIVLPRQDASPVFVSYPADTTGTTSSKESHAFPPPQLTPPSETCSATPIPVTVDSETEGSVTPLPFNVGLLRRPRDARETPSARQNKQTAPRPFSCDLLLEDRDEEDDERSLCNKRATYAADVVNKNNDRYERSLSVDDSLNRFKVAVSIDLGSIVRQNDPNREDRIGLSDDINVRKSNAEQLKVLQESVIREQNIILQTSNALSKCCHSNSAFAGSVEAVECHRLLLISTKKKETYQRAIHTLKVGGSAEGSTNEVTGKFSVSSISMPFKQEFISKLTVGEPSVVHHFIVAIRCGKTIHFSPIISTQDAVRGFLEIPGPFHFGDIDQNFELEIEVYDLSIARDVGTPKKKKLLTPKKKVLGSRSPGRHAELSVPSFFRASNFQLMGLITISMPMVNRSQFSLEKVVASSPLQGTINLKMVCLMETSIIERGFLTMFEDVNGFGAWHRRWCLLKDNVVSYWKYPDDEKSKDPIGSIDLKSCMTDVIGPIPRDICARPNTFELVTSRRQRHGETDTLVSKCVNTVTTTKHWLSADTKDERIVWCEKFNEVVHNLRLWHPDFISGGRSSSSSSTSSQDSQI